MDIVSLVVGFAIGMVVVSIAFEFGTKKTSDKEPASRHTKKWDLSEIANPRIMAEHLGTISIPKNSRVLVNNVHDKSILKDISAREHSGIKGNYILGDDRVLILSGPVKNNEMGFWSVEKDIFDKLNKEFEDFWNEASKISFE